MTNATPSRFPELGFYALPGHTSTPADMLGEPRIPLSYLESLFGPAVSDALKVLHTERERSRHGEKSELMDLLIAYDWHDSFKLGPNQREVITEKV